MMPDGGVSTLAASDRLVAGFCDDCGRLPLLLELLLEISSARVRKTLAHKSHGMEPMAGIEPRRPAPCSNVNASVPLGTVVRSSISRVCANARTISNNPRTSTPLGSDATFSSRLLELLLEVGRLIKTSFAVSGWRSPRKVRHGRAASRRGSESTV